MFSRILIQSAIICRLKASKLTCEEINYSHFSVVSQIIKKLHTEKCWFMDLLHQSITRSREVASNLAPYIAFRMLSFFLSRASAF